VKKPYLRAVSNEEEIEFQREVGAEIDNAASNAAKAIATRALVAALAACKAGTCTPEQQAMVTAMAKDAVQQTGKTFEELKGDQRTISVTLPPPAPPIPIDVKVSDLAEAAKPFIAIPEAAAKAASGSIGTTARVLGWIGDHPNLTLGLVAAGVGVWLLGPIAAPLVLGIARRR
jgi:hypothetical protein